MCSLTLEAWFDTADDSLSPTAAAGDTKVLL